ncbi:MAG: hypothetical protein ACYTGP_09850 [Planctomycetota bacterium]|jgi:hypothetical protein
MRTARVLVAIPFWIVNLWWLGHVAMALRNAPFRVYSVNNNGVLHDGWGLTFNGDSGRPLAVAYLVLVVYALIGTVVARGAMWIIAALIVPAWSFLFVGHSLWLSQWGFFQWWDWVNIAGAAIVVAHCVLTCLAKFDRAATRP